MIHHKQKIFSTIEAGDIKSAAQTIDPDNHGLNHTNDVLKTELKEKFPIDTNLIHDLPDNNTLFHSTLIDAKTILGTVAKARGRPGGINHVCTVDNLQ